MSDHMYECPGHDTTFAPNVPMSRYWQFRIETNDDPMAHLGEERAAFIYPPYTSGYEIEFVTELTLLSLMDRLAKDNHILSRFKTNECVDWSRYPAYILHAYEPVQPIGMEATYTWHTIVSDRLGPLECHVCFEDVNAENHYVVKASSMLAGVVSDLKQYDLAASGMDIELIARLLCVLELRTVMEHRIDSDTLIQYESDAVVSYVIIEHELARMRLGELDDAKWNFVKGIYAVRKALDLF